MALDFMFNYRKQIIIFFLLFVFTFQFLFIVIIFASSIPIDDVHFSFFLIINFLILIHSFAGALLLIKQKERALFLDFNPAIEFVISDKKTILYINNSAIEFLKFTFLSKKDLSIELNKWLDKNVPRLFEEPKEKFEYISSGRTILFTKIIESKSKRIIFFGADITEQKTDEIEIHRLLTGIEQSENALIITDSQGDILYVNQAFEVISGYRKNEIIGKNTNIMKSGYHNSEFYSELWETITRGGVWHGTFLNRRKSGELYWEKATITPVWNNNNEIFSFIALKEDITSQKQMEQELRIAKDEAGKASILKADFLTNMSHEIRTPLTGIVDLANVLLSTETDFEKKDILKLIRKSGKDLLGLANDILDLSKIEADKVKIIQEPFSPFEMLKQLENQFAIMADEKKLKLEFLTSSDIPSILNGGKKQIGQILGNMIENALKYTEKGFVRVHSRYENGILHISVADSGPGITEEERQNILDSPQYGIVSEKRGRTGFGLVISRKLANFMGGDISIQSKLGEGTCFNFKIPLLPGDNPEESDASPVIPLDDDIEGGIVASSTESEKYSLYSYNTTELDETELGKLGAEFKKLREHALDEDIDEILTVAERISLISQKSVIQTIAHDLRKIWEHIDEAALAAFIFKTQYIREDNNNED